MDGNEVRTPKTVPPGRQGLGAREQKEERTAVPSQSLGRSVPAAAEEVGLGLQGGSEGEIHEPAAQRLQS